jgi:hypothetical protein
MSHYRIVVFHDKDPDRLLLPYSETNRDYFVFEQVSQEEIDEAWKKFSAMNPTWTYEHYREEHYHYDESTGQWGNFYNPNTRYDYCTELWIEDEYQMKEGEQFSDDFGHFHKSQVDWYYHPTKHSEAELREEWKQYSTKGDGFWLPEYYLESYGTEEQWVKEMLRPPTPYAFVTPDGVWHAPGKVGWFAISDDTAKSRDAYWEEWKAFIDSDRDCFVSLYDCHI